MLNPVTFYAVPQNQSDTLPRIVSFVHRWAINVRELAVQHLKELRRMTLSIEFEMYPEQTGRLNASILGIAQVVSVSSRNAEPKPVPTRDTHDETSP